MGQPCLISNKHCDVSMVVLLNPLLPVCALRMIHLFVKTIRRVTFHCSTNFGIFRQNV